MFGGDSWKMPWECHQHDSVGSRSNAKNVFKLYVKLFVDRLMLGPLRVATERWLPIVLVLPSWLVSLGAFSMIFLRGSIRAHHKTVATSGVRCGSGKLVTNFLHGPAIRVIDAPIVFQSRTHSRLKCDVTQRTNGRDQNDGAQTTWKSVMYY